MGGQMVAILALGKRKNNQEWKNIPPQLSFISFSCNKVCYCICSQEATVSCCVCCAALRNCRIYIADTKKPLLSVATDSTKAKNDFGSDHRTPLASASCFTAQLTSLAQRVAVAMNHRSSATAPNAQGLCQTHSVSQTVRLFHSPGRRDMALLQSMITLFSRQMDTEIGTRLWTWVKALLQSAGALYVSRGERGVYLLTAIRWISSHALKCPFSCIGENESWERISQSFPQGHWCLATF